MFHLDCTSQNGCSNDLDDNWIYKIKQKKIDDWINIIKSYLKQNYVPNPNFLKELYNDLDKGLGLSLPSYLNFENSFMPSTDKIKKGDLGESFASYILKNKFDLVFPCLPWARKLNQNKPLSNFDLVGFSNSKNELNLISCKCSDDKKDLSSQISKVKKEFSDLTTIDLLSKLNLFFRAFESDFEPFKLNFQKILKIKPFGDKIRKIGFFIGPENLNFTNCATKFPHNKHIFTHIDLKNKIDDYFGD